MNGESEIMIFAGSASEALTQRICQHLNTSVNASTAMRFSEGNTYVRINEKVRGQDVYVVQTVGLDPNNEFMELLFWIDAFKRSSANSITAIMPHFGYAKADKKDEPRVSIRARVCADCLEVAGVDRVVTMDLHSPQIQGFFKRPVDHLYAATLYRDVIRDMGLSDCVIVSTDAGGAKSAGYYANYLGVPLAIGNKQRDGHDENARLLDIIGNVAGKDAVIVDDFTTSCGTLVETAKKLKEQGARDVYAFVSHALLQEKGVKALEASPIKRLYITDTVNCPQAAASPRVEVVSVAGMLAQTIRIIHNRESLSEMFT